MADGNLRGSIAPPTLRAETTSQRVDRVYEREPSPMSERGRAVLRLLAPFRAKPFSLQHPMAGVERYVTAALTAIDAKHSRTCVIPIGKLKECYGDLPYSMREQAKSGIRDSLGEAMAIPLKVILERATGWKPEPDVIGKSAAKDGLFERLPEQLDDATGGFIPASLLDSLTMALTFHIVALAQGNQARARQIAPFTDLFRAGHVPLGILNKDQSFVILTL